MVNKPVLRPYLSFGYVTWDLHGGRLTGHFKRGLHSLLKKSIGQA